jgi:hypothetical protein
MKHGTLNLYPVENIVRSKLYPVTFSSTVPTSISRGIGYNGTAATTVPAVTSSISVMNNYLAYRDIIIMF